jgi:hypothetical protein
MIQKKSREDTNIDSHFDENGRCLPQGLNAAVNEHSRRYFSIVQPEIKYDKIYERLVKSFNIAPELSLNDFELRAEAILGRIRSEESSLNILEGVRIPFALPKAQYDDIGTAMDTVFLNAVQQSFNNQFPEYEFSNQYTQKLSGKFSVAGGSRHEQLIEAMQQDVVVGYFFPCLLEYSVPAAIERLALLPEMFLLAGGYDLAAAFISAPDMLLRTDGYPPLLWLSGLNTDIDMEGFHFEAYGYDLNFNRRMHLNHVAEYWASGLVVLG